jgi:hypothetical protein
LERSGSRWNFPIGGGVGKIFKIGEQPFIPPPIGGTDPPSGAVDQNVN